MATVTYASLDALLLGAQGLTLYYVVSPDGNVRRCGATGPGGVLHLWDGAEADAVKQGDLRPIAATKVQNLEV